MNTITAPLPEQAAENVRSIGRSRVQLDLTPKAMKLLTDLKNKTEAGSYAEVIRNALKLYHGLITETENGNGFLVQDKAGNIAPFKMFL
jgi:hypothetical protein